MRAREGGQSVYLKKNSVASVCKRTIPTERPPLVSEVSANFLRIEGVYFRNDASQSVRPTV
jgi:hypothetical protein